MNKLIEFIKLYWIQIIIGLITFSIIIITFIKLDRSSIKRKQLKILNEKGINPILVFKGSSLAKFDLYIDENTKKIVVFDKKIIVYNYNQLKNLVYGKTVIDGRFFYNIDFVLKEDEYKVSLKGRINGSDKVKYEELKRVLDKINNYNTEKELEKITKEKQTSKKNQKSSKKLDK